MKQIIYIILIASALMFTACDDFLNPTPVSSVVVDEFFQSDADIQAGIVGLYDRLQGISTDIDNNWMRVNRGIQWEYVLTEHRSDNTRSQTIEGSQADFHRYVVDRNNIQVEDYYASMYELIFRANTMLDFIDIADEANQNTLRGEALFLRGMAYFNLVRQFSDVPLLTEVVQPGDERVFQRIAEETVYEQIFSDLQSAADLLSEGGTPGRASRGAAQAMLAKALMQGPNRDYARARGLLESVIASGQYSLMSDFNDVFYSELNDEVIFVVEYTSAIAEEAQGFSAEFDFGTGREDGLNIPEPGFLAILNESAGSRLETTVAEREFGRMVCNKYTNNSRAAGNDWIVLRYADVLLMHVESIMGGTMMTTDEAAVNSFNQVRERAGIPAIQNGLVTADQLLLERRVELAFENSRFYDLVRFGRANAVLQEYSDDNGYSYILSQLLMPIPRREINLSGNTMRQNPGY